MANGILEVPAGGMPKNDREWSQFLKTLNALIKVQGGVPGSIEIGLSPGSVQLDYLENVAGNTVLGRAGASGAVQQLAGAQIAAIAQTYIDHGQLSGLTGDDHPQYLLRSVLTTNGDLFTRISGAIARLGVGSAGQALTVVAGAPAWTTLDGTYTPTLASGANVAATGSFTAHYARTGSTVAVAGKLSVTASAGATLTQVGISLPVASALTSDEQCCGTAAAVAIAQSGGINADAANDRAQLNFIAADTSARVMSFHFSYRIL